MLNKLRWFQIAENISQVMNEKLLNVFDLNIIMFLNLMSYVKWKNDEINKKYK